MTDTVETESMEPKHQFIVRIGESEETYESREEALTYAKEQSKEVRGPVIVDSETERSTYRYVGGELAQFVMETRR